MNNFIAIGFAGMVVAVSVVQTINYGNTIENNSAMATQTSTIKSSNSIPSTIDSLVNRFIEKNRFFDGITITSAIASNSAINNKALEITKGVTNDLEKAQDIYLWIANNINYSNSLEKSVENNEDLTAAKLGAISNKPYVYKSNNGEEWTISPQDYFNSSNFSETHRNGTVVGQW
ncbi:MAG: hypothetical protein ACRDD2_00705 [Sarcina sp.]